MNDDIYKRVALELGLEESLVKETYRSYWRTIRDLIQELPLKEDLSEEEFNSLQPNFNIGGLGKLCVTSQRYKRVKKNWEYIKNLKDAKNKED